MTDQAKEIFAKQARDFYLSDDPGLSTGFVTVSPRTPLDQETPECPDPTEDPIGFCRWIRDECSCMEAPDADGDPVLVDMSSASVVVSVYDALNETNQQKLLSKGNVPAMALICWKVVG